MTKLTDCFKCLLNVRTWTWDQIFKLIGKKYSNYLIQERIHPVHARLGQSSLLHAKPTTWSKPITQIERSGSIATRVSSRDRLMSGVEWLRYFSFFNLLPEDPAVWKIVSLIWNRSMDRFDSTRLDSSHQTGLCPTYLPLWTGQTDRSIDHIASL